MTEFVRIEYNQGGKLVARLRDEFEKGFLIDENSLEVRIHNCKRQGFDTSEEEKALKALREKMVE